LNVPAKIIVDSVATDNHSFISSNTPLAKSSSGAAYSCSAFDADLSSRSISEHTYPNLQSLRAVSEGIHDANNIVTKRNRWTVIDEEPKVTALWRMRVQSPKVTQTSVCLRLCCGTIQLDTEVTSSLTALTTRAISVDMIIRYLYAQERDYRYHRCT
jgi:hypothetical protein